jgi:7,8-dihydropterin-6-yl-methyl-4-(beta-D-ribofuranosyl)aminobenzene 5'-phosphate synthase
MALLQEVEKVSITILMDNSTDFLLINTAHAVRPPLIVNEKFNLPPPVAEHGFSALVNVINKHVQINGEKNNIINEDKIGENITSNNNTYTYLFDTGVSKNGVVHNADIFGIDFNQIDGIILSHGHFDHFTGLVNILKRISARQRPTAHLDVFAHPDAFLRRWEIYPDGKRAKMPFLDERQLKQLGVKIYKNTGITFLPNEYSPSLLITGQIPRKASFEKGYPFQYAENTHEDHKKNLTPDPLVKDDQAIVINVKNKGIVILTGCGHAGVINTINYAKKITGVDKIYAVIGGFHLPADGGIYEEAIDSTLEELQKADPEYIVPCHCTGWKATNKIIDLMPEKFIQSSVGTLFTF